MLKNILISSVLLISSISAYADVVSYKIDIKNKADGRLFSITTPMATIAPIQMGDTLNTGKCSITLKNGSETTELHTYQPTGTENKTAMTTASVYPVSIVGDKVKFALVYNNQEVLVSNESKDFMQLGDNCKFHNSIVHSVFSDVNWAGELTLGKATTIPVSANNSIDVTITEVKAVK